MRVMVMIGTMDNGTWLEMMGFISIGIWQRLKGIDAEINIVVVEWQVNFGIEWPFCTNQGQYMVLTIPGRYYGNVP